MSFDLSCGPINNARVWKRITVVARQLRRALELTPRVHRAPRGSRPAGSRRIPLVPIYYAAVMLAVLPSVLMGAPAGVLPTRLRCEYLRDPLGIDAAKPRLSWVLQPLKPDLRGQRQGAFQILVSSDQKKLARGTADLWDSGRVQTDVSVQIHYAGKSLGSGQECFWKVRVWDQDGRLSGWSEPARWSMGLLQPGDWKGRWIGLDETATNSPLGNCSWIWFPENHPEKAASLGTRFFRRSFEIAGNRQVRSARWLVAGDNDFELFVNGESVGTGHTFKTALDLEIAPQLHSGKNLICAAVKNVGDAPNPAGFVGVLKVEFEDDQVVEVATDHAWQTSAEELAGWNTLNYDDSTWLPARELGQPGMQPWGDINVERRRLPARWLRKEFVVPKKLRRATAYISGLGLSELYLNGDKVGDHVLSPALSEYPKRLFYVTYDVTSQVKRGANAVGVILGNGRYFAPRLKEPTETRTYGFPKLLFQLHLQYADGSSALVTSDDAWKLTTAGPVRANNEYDGEDYDARLEMPGWATAGFKDTSWQKAQLVSPCCDPPNGPDATGPGTAREPLTDGPELSAPMINPIRVVQTLRPIAITQPRPGVYIFDLGQNMVGWCRLRVAGPRGRTISLRHAETLKSDGMLYLDNIRSAKVTDRYTLKGSGTEVYEPRFTYHGFRYVEVKGFPGEPRLSALEGRVVHDDLEATGDFACSSPLLNRIYQNIRWGFRGNYRSIPTDCPQRDERQGWLGDRSREAEGEMYLFDCAAFYSKWMRDIADAQRENGSVPDVCPAYWPFYSDNVTWPSTSIIIPGTLYDHYADCQLVTNHYAAANKWMQHMTAYVTNGLISRDSYGDWCVPPENPRLIHSEDPLRKTDKTLLATAYFYYDCLCMAQYARLTGSPADERRYSAQAESLKSAFNARFLDVHAGLYDNGSQTASVLPLAFDLVPESQRQRVFAHLVSKIREESRGHIGTGLIGGQWLMRVLTDHGRPDIGAQISTQATYPSWGYMAEKGATTIWELWNGDTADPAMNSGNHVMLVGDLLTWLFADVAGIRPDPAQAGFKHIIMRPEPVLASARATHQSIYGFISSQWADNPEAFEWQVTLPPNTTATLYLPADGPETVFESGRPATAAPGVKSLGMEKDRAVLQVLSGTYKFKVVKASSGGAARNAGE